MISKSQPHSVARRGLVLIPEESAIFPSLSVKENIEMFAELCGEDSPKDEFVERCTATFPILGNRIHQKGGTLSGGEQRMLALSRGLGKHVRMLMIDEISLGLAPAIVSQLFEELSVLAASGLTILIVEQFVQEALKLADFVYVLARGEFVHSCPPDEFEGSAASAYGVE